MDIILTHEQADFDAAGSVLAAWLLDPARIPVLPKRRNRNLAAFIEDYKNRLPFFTWNNVPKGTIHRVYITDTQKIEPHSRLENVRDYVIWDHHPHRHVFPDREENIYDPTGACTTFLVEKLMEKPGLHPGRIFTTLMLMGIYEDTGSLSYGSTTPRDIRAAAWLVEKGADLDLMRRYVLQPMTDNQQAGCERLIQTMETYEIRGKNIIIASADIRTIGDEFSAVAHQLRDMFNPDGLILLLAVRTGVRLICRATTDDIDFGAMMRTMNGGGHSRAASGMIQLEYMEIADAEDVLSDARETVLESLPNFIKIQQQNLSEKLNEQIPAEQLSLIHNIADCAEQLDMPVYIVGGVVRDLLLNHPVMDFDIVVEGDATRLGQQLTAQYGGKLVTHPQFFTAKWQMKNGMSLDLISARSETYSSPAALPTVEMADIEADLHRRDFSLNTLAVRLDGEYYGQLLDLCGGLQDLQDGLIRTLHNRSFIDDPTRLFRAVRFEQRLGFEMESDTLQQIRGQLNGIAGLTGQRIWHELRLYCDEEYPEKDFSRIVQLGFASQIHDALIWNEQIEQDCIRFRETVPGKFWQTLSGLDFDMVEADGAFWTWLSSFPVNIITQTAERLLLPKKEQHCIEGLSILRTELPNMIRNAPSEITYFLEKLPSESLYCYALFCTEPELDILKKFVNTWHRIQPSVTGNDLLDMGVRPGPEMKHLLTMLRSACIDTDIQPEEEIEWVEMFLKKGLDQHVR